MLLVPVVNKSVPKLAEQVNDSQQADTAYWRFLTSYSVNTPRLSHSKQLLITKFTFHGCNVKVKPPARSARVGSETKGYMPLERSSTQTRSLSFLLLMLRLQWVQRNQQTAQRSCEPQSVASSYSFVRVLNPQ